MGIPGGCPVCIPITRIASCLNEPLGDMTGSAPTHNAAAVFAADLLMGLHTGFILQSWTGRLMGAACLLGRQALPLSRAPATG